MDFNKIYNKLLLVPIIILGANLIFRMINQSVMMFNFPIDGTDWSAHIFETWALAKYGFHCLVPDWYNGYILLKFYTPGWNFFSLPFYKLTSNLLYASFSALVALFILGFIGIYVFGRVNGFSKKQTVLFYLLFFGNALAVTNFIRNGRVPEFLAWVIFVFLMSIIFYFKDRPLDYRFLLAAPLMCFLILAHFTEPVTFGFLFLGFILIKPLKEKVLAFATMGLGTFMAAFWWWPILRDLKQSAITGIYFSERMFNLDFLNGTLVAVVCAAFLMMFYFYLKDSKNAKREFLFYLPICIFLLLFISRLTTFIPILDRLYPQTNAEFLIFFTLFFFFKINWKTQIIKKAVITLLVLISLGSVLVNVIDTKSFDAHGEAENEAISVLSHATGRFYVTTNFGDVYPTGLYGYAPIYLGLQTSSGWMPVAVTQEYDSKLASFDNMFKDRRCEAFQELKDIKTEDVLSFEDDCIWVKQCGFKMIYQSKNACLYRI